MPHNSPTDDRSLTTFGAMLRFLRRRANLTQRDLSIAVGYSMAQISLLENGQRLPDLTAVAALFVPALNIEAEPELARRLLELAATARQLTNSPTPDPWPPTPDPQAPPPIPYPLSPIPHLPAPALPLIGRQAELEVARLRLQDPAVRLVSLLGPPGVGKTRLALELA